jgi:hypothetical protein
MGQAKLPKSVVAPNNSSSYKYTLVATAQAGVLPAFRDMCMLLKAPPFLNSFFLVVSNIAYMLRALPDGWAAEDMFPGWSDMLTWALEHRAALIAQAPTLKENPRQKIVLGVRVAVPPSKAFGLTNYPIYSTLCTVHELPEQRESYARLQGQLLVARRKELEKNKAHNRGSYVDAYERCTELGDFAKHVRQPDAAARAIREISSEKYGQMLTYICPERSPEVFASSLPKPGVDLPQIPFLQQALQNIRHYCGLKTSPRSNIDRESGDRYGGGPGIYGYVEYSKTRFGIEFTNGDPDDPDLDLSQLELIREHSVDRELALANDLDPGESVHNAGWALLGDSQQTGSTPGKLAAARTRVAAIEIDKERMPWSALHLRPKEIAGTLLSRLIATAKKASLGRVEEAELENCALIAVTLETARPLSAALSIHRKKIPEGDFLFVPSERGHSIWCWKAIEPLYTQARPAVPGKEVMRSLHLCHRVHPVANLLLRAWQQYLPASQSELFKQPCDTYEKRLKPWLRELDPTGRLTLSKIARVKWSLLSQAAGGDLSDASLVLGQPHPIARVPLFYSLLSVEDAGFLFEKATSALWMNVWADGETGNQEKVLA